LAFGDLAFGIFLHEGGPAARFLRQRHDRRVGDDQRGNPQVSLHGGMAGELSLSGEALGAIDHPLANAMFAFAVLDADEQRRLLGRVVARSVGRGSNRLLFDDAQSYYVNGLAYLPFLARAGRYVPPGVPARR